MTGASALFSPLDGDDGETGLTLSCSVGLSTTLIELPSATSPVMISWSDPPPLKSAPKTKSPETLPSIVRLLSTALLRASMLAWVMNRSAPAIRLSPPAIVIRPRSLSKRLSPAPKSITDPFMMMLPELVTRPALSIISVFMSRSSPRAERHVAHDRAHVDDVGIDSVVGVEADGRTRSRPDWRRSCRC